MRNYFLSPIAESDIDEIVSYINEENAEAALKFLNALFESMEISFLKIR